MAGVHCTEKLVDSAAATTTAATLISKMKVKYQLVEIDGTIEET